VAGCLIRTATVQRVDREDGHAPTSTWTPSPKQWRCGSARVVCRRCRAAVPLNTSRSPARPQRRAWTARLREPLGGTRFGRHGRTRSFQDDPLVVTRFIIGMCMWVSRWHRPAEGDTRGGDGRRSNVANPVVAGLAL
jgi:hypothetical protein